MWIKICGVRDPLTAQAVARAGADAIGLNFYAESSRCIAPAVASDVVAALPTGVEAVGVFVNSSVESILTIAAECRLTTLQLHGDESPELLAELQAADDSCCRLIRALRVDETGLGEVAAYLERLEALGVRLAGCLIDARVSGQYGGTGATAPWELIGRDWRHSEWPPLILAGGLTPGNVAAGVKQCRARGVDVAGGVETSPGVKDLSLVTRFIQNARAAS